MCSGTATFVNWSGNLVNKRAPIRFPADDGEIKALLRQAATSQCAVRVVGARHSQAPAVCASNERKVMLVSLARYRRPGDESQGQGLNQDLNQDRKQDLKQDQHPDLVLDHERQLARVNAGWTLAQLYDELRKHHYFLETQTASSAFSVGGVVCMPVHGARLGGGLMADGVVGLTLIDADQRDVTKAADRDADFDLYRLSAGLLGVITSVTFRLQVLSNLNLRVTTFYNLFSRDASRVEDEDARRFLRNLVEQCVTIASDRKEASSSLAPSSSSGAVDAGGRGQASGNLSARYVQCLVDYQNNVLLALMWNRDDSKRSTLPEEKAEADATQVTKLVSVGAMMSTVNRDFRQSATQLRLLSLAARLEAEHSVESDLRTKRDMFWVSTAVRCYFMCYFVPVYAGGRYQLDNLHAALTAVAHTIKRARDEQWSFNLDLPSDLRFVVSGGQGQDQAHAQLSPLASTTGLAVYAAIDIPCSAADIDLSRAGMQGSSCCGSSDAARQALNRDFRRFYYGVEQSWIELGGRPHWAKLFGFSAEDGEPFDPRAVATLLPPATKAAMASLAPARFQNGFTRALLAT